MPEQLPQRPNFEVQPQQQPEHQPVNPERQEQPGVGSSTEEQQANTTHQATVQQQSHQSGIPAKDAETKAIESILESGMESFFQSLSYEKKLEFKEKGEETAIAIKQKVHSGSYSVKDIISLIVNWLKGLPGINKFFLEQEAKIKADSIVKYYKH